MGSKFFVLAAMSVALSAGSVEAKAEEAAGELVQVDDRYLTLTELRSRYGDEDSKYADIQGMRIHYKDEGEGPAVLMVHGSYGSLRNFDYLAQTLSQHYRVIRYDVGGMGLSGRISDEVAEKVTPVDIAKGLLDQLGIEEVIFVGFSSGGTLGMYLAAEYPDMVRHLILSNVPADRVTYGHMVQPQSFIDAQAQAEEDGGFMARPFWDEYLSYFAGDPERFSTELRDEYFDLARRTREEHPIALVAQIGDGLAANERMRSITTPSVLIWGGSDALLTLDAMNSLERHLENSEVSKIIMPDVGHYPPVEVPGRFASIVETYLEAALDLQP